MREFSWASFGRLDFFDRLTLWLPPKNGASAPPGAPQKAVLFSKAMQLRRKHDAPPGLEGGAGAWDSGGYLGVLLFSRRLFSGSLRKPAGHPLQPIRPAFRPTPRQLSPKAPQPQDAGYAAVEAS